MNKMDQPIAKRQNVYIQGLIWQFRDVPKNILKAWRNFLGFNLQYFSIPLLLKTLFSYWRNYQMSYGRGFDFKRYFEAFTLNIMSRVLGAVIRLILMSIGIIVEVFIFFAGLIVFLFWIFLPVILIVGLIFGLQLLI